MTNESTGTQWYGCLLGRPGIRRYAIERALIELATGGDGTVTTTAVRDKARGYGYDPPNDVYGHLLWLVQNTDFLVKLDASTWRLTEKGAAKGKKTIADEVSKGAWPPANGTAAGGPLPTSHPSPPVEVDEVICVEDAGEAALASPPPQTYTPPQTIRIDSEVWFALQKIAIPFVETPNDVIRRLLKLSPRKPA
jgi:hypothetical protein